jgi:hypothetical protein
MKPRVRSILVLVILIVSAQDVSFSHCDTMNGPVVIDAQKALETGNVTGILKWVKKEQESEVVALFKKTISVRTKGADIREIADRHFFETVVRLHRAGEGMPFTGLKDSTELEPGIEAAENALASNTADGLINEITNDVADDIRKRFSSVTNAKKNADKSSEAGRTYVAAYVDFIHFIENIHVLIATSSHSHHGEAGEHKH